MQFLFLINLPETDARAIYGEEINALCKFYAAVLNRINFNKLQLKQVEWPGLKVDMKRQNVGVGVQKFYKRLFCDPNLVDTFKNILMCVEIVLCIPMSSAICERGFSAIARIKSDWRASKCRHAQLLDSYFSNRSRS